MRSTVLPGVLAICAAACMMVLPASAEDDELPPGVDIRWDPTKCPICNAGWREPIPAPFITTWETTAPGQTVIIWLSGEFIIDWGDGKTGSSGGITDKFGNRDPGYFGGYISHLYSEPGTYQVVISGNLYDFAPSSGSTGRFVSVDQWGDSVWSRFDYTFEGVDGFAINAADAPYFGRGADLSEMFWKASFTGDLNHWDVSNVTNMGGMFASSSFNGNIGNWFITLDDNTVNNTDFTVGRITAQSPYLDSFVTEYTVDHPAFWVTNGDVLKFLPWYRHSPTDHYNVTLRATLQGFYNPGDTYRQVTILYDPPIEQDGGQAANMTVSNATNFNATGTDVLNANVTSTNATNTIQDTVQEAPNRQPLAYAHLFLVFEAGQVVTLNGTGSWDPDGDTLTYRWSQTSGANVTLSDYASPVPTFVPPAEPHLQSFIFELVVNDGEMDSNPSTAVVMIQRPEPGS